MGHKGPLPPLPLFITTEQVEAACGLLGIPPASVSSVLVRKDRVEVVRYRRDQLGRAIPAGSDLATETTVIGVLPAEAITLDKQLAAMGV